MKSLRREARVHDGGDLHTDRRVLGDLAATARLVARLLQLRVRHEDRVEAGPRIGVQVLEGRPEAGQSPELEEQVRVRAMLLDGLDALRRPGVEMRVADEPSCKAAIGAIASAPARAAGRPGAELIGCAVVNR